MSLFNKIHSAIETDPENWSAYMHYYKVLAEKKDWVESERFKQLIVRNIMLGIPIAKDLNFLLEDVLLLEARNLRFDSYMQYLELDREPQNRFWLPRRKQLLGIVNDIQDLIDDKLDILSISLPPGTGKSTLEIFLHSMLAGHYPDKHSLGSGHSGTLTNSIYIGVLSIIEDRVEYRWHDIFPNAGDIITNAKEQTLDIGKKHRFSTLTCRAINASLTGATRCDNLLTADDLVSGIEEALNITRLDKLWATYNNDLKSRKKLGCKELHLATRWSVHDVIGRLERLYENNPRAKFVAMSALDENGESNFNYDYGVGFDTAYFLDMKKGLDDASYKALYENQPIEREGLLYDVSQLRRYFELPSGEPDAIISICDTKDRGKDYAFLPVGYLYGKNWYIEDCVCDDRLPEIVDDRLVDMLLKHKVQMARFESNSAGGRVADKVNEKLKSKGGNTHITTKFSTANKETKIIVHSEWVKENCLFKENYQPGSDYDKMIKFLISYSVAGKNVFDDVPDGMAMFSDFAQGLSGQKVEVFRRVF